MRLTGIRKISICMALVMLFAVVLPGNVLGADQDYEVDLGSLQDECPILATY